MSQRSRLLIGLIVALVVLVGALFVMPFLNDEYFYQDWSIVLSYGVPYLLCLVISLCFKKFSKITIPSLKPRISKFSPSFAVSGVVLMYATQIIVSPLVNFIPAPYISYIIDNQPVLELNGFYPQLTLVFILPILQQWTFRGIFQDNISKALGPMWGIFLSAFFFSLTYMLPRDIVYMFGAGVTLAAIYYITESLSTVIFINILFNGINYLIFLFFDTKIWWSEVFEGNVINYVIFWTLSALLVIITAWRVSNHYDKKLLRKNINKK